MYFAQLDGEITNKQSQELLDKEYKKAIELENILKASMEYQSTDYKRRYISWKKMKVILPM